MITTVRDATTVYHENAVALIARIRETQMPAIEAAAGIVEEVIKRDGIVYTFGGGHSSLVATELCYRAGGLACFDLIPERTFGRAERLEGYGKVLLDASPISANDALIVVSNSGRNACPIEMALEASARGIATIAITSVGQGRHVASRHSSGRRLHDVADIVIDTCVPHGDASIPAEELSGGAIGPLSTLAGVFVANLINITAITRCMQHGVRAPVLTSANIDGGDERNAELMQYIRTRIHGV